MKVGKAAAATAVAGLVLLGSAGSASALTLDLSGIGGLVQGTTNEVGQLLGSNTELPAGIEAPSYSANANTDGIHVEVGDVVDIQIGTHAPAVTPPAIPVDPALPAPQLPVSPTLPTDSLPRLPIKLPEASIPETPESVQALRDFALIEIDFFRSDVEGMATTMVNDGRGWVDSGSSFAYRTAGMTVDLAGLTAVRLMVASAYEYAADTAETATP
ncbi:MAG TPA: hypothetical protein VMY88_01500 [Acidimicrobiales bacterium]|nr:hypothetical protein [Acidimicrobiales bacterium]